MNAERSRRESFICEELLHSVIGVKSRKVGLQAGAQQTLGKQQQTALIVPPTERPRQTGQQWAKYEEQKSGASRESMWAGSGIAAQTVQLELLEYRSNDGRAKRERCTTEAHSPTGLKTGEFLWVFKVRCCLCPFFGQSLHLGEKRRLESPELE